MLMPTRSMHRLSLAAGAVLLATTLAACGGTPTAPGGTGPQPPAASAPNETSPAPAPTPDPVTFKPNVKNGATGVKVDTVVTVAATAGTLTKVKLSYTNKDRQGRTQHGVVSGTMSKDRLKWTANARLDPATAYKLTSAGKNTVNQAQSVATSFRTQNLALSRQTYPQIYPLKGSHVGVGMPVVLTFDVPVKNKQEFEKNLHVKSSPAQLGTWHWYSSTEVRYRPKKYWKPGTKVVCNRQPQRRQRWQRHLRAELDQDELHCRPVADHQDQFVLRRCEGVSQRQAASAPSMSAVASLAGRPAVASS